jgi:hypothetical protein
MGGVRLIININSGLVQVLEILVVYFIKQNLVLGFVGQNLACSLIKYISIIISLSAENYVVGGPKIIGCFLIVK